MFIIHLEKTLLTSKIFNFSKKMPTKVYRCPFMLLFCMVSGFILLSQHKKTFVTFTMYNLVSFNILLFGGIYMFEVYMFGNLMRRFISAFTIITIKIINFFTEMNSKVH